MRVGGDPGCLSNKPQLPPQNSVDMLWSKGRIIFENLLNAMAARQIIRHRFQRHASAIETGLAPEDFWINAHYLLQATRNVRQHGFIVQDGAEHAAIAAWVRLVLESYLGASPRSQTALIARSLWVCGQIGAGYSRRLRLTRAVPGHSGMGLERA